MVSIYAAILPIVGGVARVTHQSPFGFDEGPVLSVHLVVEAAGVAEVVARAVPSPQGRGGGSAVDTFPPLCAACRWKEEQTGNL